MTLLWEETQAPDLPSCRSEVVKLVACVSQSSSLAVVLLGVLRALVRPRGVMALVAVGVLLLRRPAVLRGRRRGWRFEEGLWRPDSDLLFPLSPT